MRILLARHGETPWNAEGRYQGQEDIPLSDTGERQATLLGARLADVRIDRAVASPLSRADRTARLALGAVRASTLATDPGLAEIAHGTWEGLLASEIRARDPERLTAWRDAPDTVQMPGGAKANVKSGPGLLRKVNNRTRETMEERVFMLDLDLYMDSKIELNHTAPALNIVHDNAGSLFRAAITDTLADAMEPQKA